MLYPVQDEETYIAFASEAENYTQEQIEAALAKSDSIPELISCSSSDSDDEYKQTCLEVKLHR